MDAFLKEVYIETSSINSFKFAQCSNSKCRSVFAYITFEEFAAANFLCPVCRHKIKSHHMVQCRNCESIVNLFSLESGEEPIVFYVKKCHHCNGSLEDEVRIQPFMYPEVYM